jgi:predicted metal-dependent hydrolase
MPGLQPRLGPESILSFHTGQQTVMARKFLQFTLDLFGVEAAAPAGPASPAALVPKVPLAHTQTAQPAIEIVAPSGVCASATFRHPRATREVLLAGRLVGYELKRRKRLTIGFSVGAEGLAVSAPKWVPLGEIDEAVRGKSGWILKKLQETRERHRRLEAARIDWKDGAVFPFLGEPVRVVLEPLQRHAVLQPARQDGAGERTLRIGLPRAASSEQVRLAVRAWLVQQAGPIFTQRLDHFAPQLGVQWRKLGLSSATTRWGSASASGAIRLNWRLLHFKPAVIDYVVVHELSHLRVMDHSARFWQTVGAVMPDYALLRRQLKSEAAPCC